MDTTILKKIESSILNLATAYETFSKDPSNTHEKIKEFDKELSDLLDRYIQLNNIKNTLTEDDLQIIVEELNATIELHKTKLLDGSYNGKDGINGTNGTNGVDGQDGSDGVNGTNGINGQDGSNGTNGTDGQDGKSAYEIALEDGFVGSKTEWLESLNGTDGSDGQNGSDGKDGADGQDGTNGQDGSDGSNGTDGQNGKSAYEIALEDGFVGSKTEWLEALNGTNGVDGNDGSDGKDGINGNDGQDGTNGTNGQDGSDGSNGSNGKDGKSAYAIALGNGFVGTEEEWIKSLGLVETEWIDLTLFLVNGWVAYDGVSYPLRGKRIGKQVFLEGLASGGNTRVILDNLPEEFRPKNTLFLSPMATRNEVTDKTYNSISPAGSFACYSYSTIWTSIACTYLTE